ncbi:MAG TPA: hypothetical protein VH878_01750 [Thermodesulfobacteriota bacterium]|jgi:hypothetical protein
MKDIDQSKKKLKDVEKLLAEVRGKIKNLSKENLSQPKKILEGSLTPLEELRVVNEKVLPTDEILPSEKDFQSEYEILYEEFVLRNFKAIGEFIKGKNKVYLKAFCIGNNLPINADRTSKGKIVDEVMQWMARRKAIAKKVT